MHCNIRLVINHDFHAFITNSNDIVRTSMNVYHDSNDNKLFVDAYTIALITMRD